MLEKLIKFRSIIIPLVLVLGVIAGTILVRQPQELRERAATVGTVTGRVYCSIDGQNIGGINIGVMNGLETVGTAATNSSGNFSVTFDNLGRGEFAVRVGQGNPFPSGTNSGYTATGSENICTGAGYLIQHERCPFSGISGKTVSGFDFKTDKSPLDIQANCTGNSGTFTWKETGGAQRYALRVDHADDPWVGPKDFFRWVPTNPSGQATIGSCDGTTCTVTLDEDDVNSYGNSFQPGDYYGFSVQAQYAGEYHCRLDSGPFTCQSCVLPLTPTNPLPQGNTLCDLNTITLRWDSVSGADAYELRVDNLENGWSGSCQNPNPGDSCATVNSLSHTVEVVPGKSYKWWVHSRNSCGWSEPAHGQFSVPICTPTPTPTPPTGSCWKKLNSTPYTNMGCGQTINFSPVTASAFRVEMVGGGGSDCRADYDCTHHSPQSNGVQFLTNSGWQYAHLPDSDCGFDCGETAETITFQPSSVSQAQFEIGCWDNETVNVDIYYCESSIPTPGITAVVNTPTPVHLMGDLDGDGNIDIDDLNIFINSSMFGKTGSPGFTPEDIIEDGKVDIFDLNKIFTNYTGEYLI